MGTTLKFSSSFHPQIDGQSEEANSTDLDLLKCYVSEHKATWEHYLPLVEYAYNNTVHTSTGKAPFEIVEGGKKVPPILQTKDNIFEADKYVQNMDEAYRKIKLALEKTQSKKRKLLIVTVVNFSLGDWVLLRFDKARLRKMKGKERLSPKLEDMVPEEQLEVEELDEILVPKQMLAHKDWKVRGKVARRYLVKFKNYSPMDAKWMEEVELVDYVLCRDCYSNGNLGIGMTTSDFIPFHGQAEQTDNIDIGSWSDQETLMLLEALELYGDNWTEVSEFVGTKSKAQCISHFIGLSIEDKFFEDMEVPHSFTTVNTEHVNLHSQEDTAVKGIDLEANLPLALDKSEAIMESGNQEWLQSEAEIYVAFEGANNPVMSLVAILAATVGPRVAAVAAHTALSSLSEHYQATRT
ncbi:hypothetical protein L7F22_027415 [Adiantum nelumboides]|nr:hypothetical protein [Adiantum nelumboides]